MWFSVRVEMVAAPWLLLPIAIGAAHGLLLWVAALVSECGHRRGLLLGALTLAGVLVVGRHAEHYRLRLQVVANQRAEVSRQGSHAGMFANLFIHEPSSFFDYLQLEASQGRGIGNWTIARGPWTWVSWGGDAFLLIASSLTCLAYASRGGYCQRCGSWYRRGNRGRQIKSAKHLPDLTNIAKPTNGNPTNIDNSNSQGTGASVEMIPWRCRCDFLPTEQTNFAPGECGE